MKKLLFVIIFVSLAFIGLAETPPTLDNHQFYGDVFWREAITAPTEVVAIAGGSSHTTPIRNPRCAEGICSGSYGRDPDTILRLQGTAGQQIVFYLNDEQVGSVAYEAGKAQDLDLFLDITAEEVSLEETPIGDPDGEGSDDDS